MFEPEEIEALLIPLSYSEDWAVTMQCQRVAVALLFAFETAMRAGEICSIRAADIDFKKRTVFLPKTKNGHPRTVPLSTEAVRLLKRLEPFPNDDPVFRLSSGTLSTLFRKAREQAGLDDLTFHDSRHEGTTRLAQKLEVMDLARVTGHKDIRQLMTYYNKKAHHIAELLD
ncbi:site-specific integrase [Pseudomaricurvus alkylphenolicus]|uniref:site-specific integrase n=1 Tax=Pseudomaricurvus alkylphenolicus TaxID=1306991 RepID=UPI0014219985|nr:site-specific integrase [Pseudomaricurvus alkylphenolicus]NIB45242.1 site-specific integrase [Pseudomaricurvus alkylphenolicus]